MGYTSLTKRRRTSRPNTRVIQNLPTTTPLTNEDEDPESPSQNNMSMIAFAPTSHVNVVTEIGIAPTNECDITSTPSTSRETFIIPAREGNFILSLSLIQDLNEASIIEEGSTSDENLPFIIKTTATLLSPIAEVDEIKEDGSDRNIY